MVRFFEYLRWRFTAKKRAKASILYKAQKYSAIKSCNQQGYDICLLGDSLIEYWKIQTLCGKKCFNAGVGDATTEDVLQQLQNSLLSASFQTFVIIIGTNDVKYGYSAEKTVDNLTRIIEFVKNDNPKSDIIYLTIPPVNGRWDRKNDALEERNNAILNVIPKEVQVLHLDFLKDSKGKLKTEYTIDGLHFSETAYELIENKLKKIINNEQI